MEGGVPRHMPEVVVALTGASGAKYCVRLIEALVEHKWSVRLIVTGTGAINLDLECSMTPSELASMDGVILEDNGNLAMKERRKLIIVPREAPYSTPHLKAMFNLSEWGAVILPASPGFYNSPESIDDLVDFVVARILDQLDIDHSIGRRWSGEEVPLED